MKQFFSLYQQIYPQDLHIKHELWYYISKYRVMSAILTHIKQSGKKQFAVADIGGGYGYDDILLNTLIKQQFPDVTLTLDVIDPTVDFYNTVHKLEESDIRKQHQITYIEQSLLTIAPDAYTHKYDILLCCEVIEHLWTNEQEVFFSQFNRMCKPDGMIALTVPNGSSTLKQLAGLYTWKRKQNHLFTAEFHYRYSHIGVPTLFQVLWLFQRKWFQVTRIFSTTPLSSTKTTLINRFFQQLFSCLGYFSLFFSTDVVYIAKKTQPLDETVWHNSTQKTLDTKTALTPETLQA